MEPLTALGLASSVVQLVDFTGKVISQTVKIYRTAPKGKDQDEHMILENVTRGLLKYSENLEKSLKSQTLNFASEHGKHSKGFQNILPSAAPLVVLSTADQEVVDICKDCKKISARLLAVLNKLRSSKITLWNSFLDALKTMWSEEEIQSLRQALDTYWHQMSLYLLVSIRDEIRVFRQKQSIRDDKLLSTVEETQAAVSGFFEMVTERPLWQEHAMQTTNIENDSSISSITRSIPTVGMQNDLSDIDIRRFDDAVLKWLQFSEVDLRHEKIDPAHEATFQWIFRPLPDDQWSNFVEWLEADSETLYWITGKPAAGKSTLMKFIHTDSRTTEHLHSWAKDKKLITSAFYFWNSGTQIQMSRDGMARTLLYKTLCQAPELRATLFPQKMEEYIAFGKPWRKPITWEDMMDAFRLLVEGAGRDYNVFFFIDGLDEYDGSHKELVTLIQGFLSPHVKTCVSSRPWNVFEDAFHQLPSLKLEDITFEDIKHVVDTKFSSNKGFTQLRMLDPQYADQLMANIIRKASGVFLWVALVTDSLLEGLSDGERLEELQARLDALPVDLESLFGKILNRLGESHLARASELFQIVHASITPLDLLMFSYADEQDPDIALKIPMQPLSTTEAHARALILRRRLNACCKGLIESKSVNTNQCLAEAKVGFLHRTVKDYVERPEVWHKLLAMTDKQFSPHARLCSAHVIKLKISDRGLFLESKDESLRLFDEIQNGRKFWNLITFAMEYASRADPDCSKGIQPKLLGELDTAATYLATLEHQESFSFLEERTQLTRIVVIDWSATISKNSMNRCFLHLLVQYHFYDCVQFMISTKPKKLNQELLDQALQVAISAVGCQWDDRPALIPGIASPAMIKLLLENGANPNVRLSLLLYGASRLLTTFSSPWDTFLQTSRPEGKNAEELGMLFLQYGADPSLLGKKWKCCKKMWALAKVKKVEKIFGVKKLRFRFPWSKGS